MSNPVHLGQTVCTCIMLPVNFQCSVDYNGQPLAICSTSKASNRIKHQVFGHYGRRVYNASTRSWVLVKHGRALNSMAGQICSWSDICQNEAKSLLSTLQ